MHITTLYSAQQRVKGGAVKGVECPCCGSFIKKYKRKLNSGMARFLIGLYKLDMNATASEVINYMKLGVSASDYSLLEHWNLIERTPNKDKSKRRSGIWRPTYAGTLFVENKISVPSHCIIYKGEPERFLGAEINILMALGERFDYKELMNP